MNNNSPIWSYISKSDFDVPASPTSEAAKGGVIAVWNRLKGMLYRSGDSSPEALPERLPLEEVVNAASLEPDWHHAALALAEELDPWIESQNPDRRHRVLIGPPGCDVAAVLHAISQQRAFLAFDPPISEAILGQSAGVGWSSLDDSSPSGVLVIPQLAHCYLRHASGLTLIRRLLEQIVASRHHVLVGCDSWAWAFLQRAVGIEDLLGEPLTFAPFDGNRLDSWFRSRVQVADYEFRQIGSDKSLFLEPPKSSDGDNSPSSWSGTPFIQNLAACARGNPAVAQAFWRAGLRRGEPESDESVGLASDHDLVLRVVSPSQLTPRIPDEVDRVHRFVLHALLLHGGMTLSSLQLILPFDRADIVRRVTSLHRWGLLEDKDDIVQVRLVAYPTVRQNLLDEGFLTDAF